MRRIISRASNISKQTINKTISEVSKYYSIYISVIIWNVFLLLFGMYNYQMCNVLFNRKWQVKDYINKLQVLRLSQNYFYYVSKLANYSHNTTRLNKEQIHQS